MSNLKVFVLLAGMVALSGIIGGMQHIARYPDGNTTTEAQA